MKKFLKILCIPFIILLTVVLLPIIISLLISAFIIIAGASSFILALLLPIFAILGIYMWIKGPPYVISSDKFKVTINGKNLKETKYYKPHEWDEKIVETCITRIVNFAFNEKFNRKEMIRNLCFLFKHYQKPDYIYSELNSIYKEVESSHFEYDYVGIRISKLWATLNFDPMLYKV